MTVRRTSLDRNPSSRERSSLYRDASHLPWTHKTIHARVDCGTICASRTPVLSVFSLERGGARSVTNARHVVVAQGDPCFPLSGRCGPRRDTDRLWCYLDRHKRKRHSGPWRWNLEGTFHELFLGVESGLSAVSSGRKHVLLVR